MSFGSDFGSILLQGEMYRDTICLNEKAVCSANQEFVAVTNIIGGENWESNGVVGLAPTKGEQSLIL